VPERLDLIIVKMTAKLPKYRYQNCADVIKDLEGLGLAATTLGFLHGKVKPTTGLKLDKQATSITDTASESWYVRVHLGEGELGVRRLTTTQLKKMLEEGTIDPTAQASRQPTEGFRSLATFKEFQGTAFVKQSKKGADTQTARFRTIYKKIEENERKRDLEDQKNTREPSYYSQLWAPGMLIAAAITGVVIFFYIFIKLFS
jgi:eukaryotic-like serine/threonine-protein kinase